MTTVDAAQSDRPRTDGRGYLEVSAVSLVAAAQGILRDARGGYRYDVQGCIDTVKRYLVSCEKALAEWDAEEAWDQANS